MPKRSAQEKLEKHQRKIRKLQEEEQIKEKEKKRSRIRRLPDSSDDEHNEHGDSPPENPTDGDETQPQAAQDEQPATTTPGPDTAQPTEIDLDPELLSALGASTSDTPEFGANIHESLTKLWTPLLKKGLQKDDKDKLTKEYLVPANCKLLQAPKLNAEITASVSETVRGRDKKLTGFQQQLGTGTSAVNRAMDTLIASDNKILALKYLSDACRLLTDLHYNFTKDRIKLITPSLEKNFVVLQNTERDDTLFGNALSEKIKASKAIQRQGSQIRKTSQVQKTTLAQSTVNRPAPQGNWSGPPRYPSIRGGRGGQRRPASTPRRTYNPTQTPAKTSFNQPKTRAAPPQ